MQWSIIVVGKPALSFAAQGVEEYLGRLRRYTKAELIFLKEGPRAVLAERYAQAAAGAVRLVLDERGELPTTEQFRQRVDRWELSGIKKVAVLIGPADGHTEAMRQSADWLVALSRLTLQHELALVVALEQLYRVYTLKKGEPYHR